MRARIQANPEWLAIRLGPGKDVYQTLLAVAQQECIQAGTVVSAVGSLASAQLRFADQATATTLTGRHEILTLSGTLGQDGLHLHMTVADAQGSCRGGHLMPGCRIYTTLELVIAILPGIRFARTVDPETGFRELQITRLSS
ncbi:MAG: PPC domain-containing DNA-binding protein [Cyanobacteria bacterium J06648_16]